MDGRPMDYEDCQTLVEIQSDEGIVHGKLVVFASYTKERAPGFTLERVICFMTFFGGHAKTEDIITSPALDIFGFGVCSLWSLIYSCARDGPDIRNKNIMDHRTSNALFSSDRY